MVKNHCMDKKKDFWLDLGTTSSSTLLCLVGELAGGGSVAVAVGVSDM